MQACISNRRSVHIPHVINRERNKIPYYSLVACHCSVAFRGRKSWSAESFHLNMLFLIWLGKKGGGDNKWAFKTLMYQTNPSLDSALPAICPIQESSTASQPIMHSSKTTAVVTFPYAKGLICNQPMGKQMRFDLETSSHLITAPARTPPGHTPWPLAQRMAKAELHISRLQARRS